MTLKVILQWTLRKGGPCNNVAQNTKFQSIHNISVTWQLVKVCSEVVEGLKNHFWKSL